MLALFLGTGGAKVGEDEGAASGVVEHCTTLIPRRSLMAEDNVSNEASLLPNWES